MMDGPAGNRLPAVLDLAVHSGPGRPLCAWPPTLARPAELDVAGHPGPGLRPRT